MTMSILNIALIGGGSLIGAVFFLVFIPWVLSLRRVVPANQVDIVQTSRSRTSYGGRDAEDGNGHSNTYYAWPSWIPVIGVTTVTLPVSVFDLDLEGYEAYDVGRLPFVVDIKAFFRIIDSNLAASRVATFGELREQLMGVMSGACRAMLAKRELESIMEDRASFGEEFTKEVNAQLKEWGVTTVKNIELMDIRDNQQSQVIHQIMSKKMSQISMESRQTVAANEQKAAQAEIDANREVDLQAQEAQRQTGLNKAKVDQEVGIANEKAAQEIKEQARVTKEKDMAILQVATVKQAEITRASQVVLAGQDKETAIIRAEGALEAQRREAEGIEAIGKANAEAAKAMQMAPVQAQIALAQEIGGNEKYQQYLITVREIEAKEKIGIEQANALTDADVKVIATAGDAPKGIASVGEMFTPKGGVAIASMLEGLVQTPEGEALMGKLTGGKKSRASNGVDHV